jgi:hypothetical protein
MAHEWPCMRGLAREGMTESRRASVCLSRTLALVIRPMVLVVMLCGWTGAAVLVQAAEPEYEPDVILVIKEKTFQMLKGNASGEGLPHLVFSLSPGDEITLELRNEDRLPHEFVSPLFGLVEFQFWGKATLVYTYTATGIRIEPEETVALRFELPKGFSGKQFKFWCNVHGKLHNDALQGEILVVKSKQGTS